MPMAFRHWSGISRRHFVFFLNQILMYKKILVVLAIALLPFAFSECSESGNSVNTELSESTHACPMDCENGKTYTEEGTCPVCEMDLVEVED